MKSRVREKNAMMPRNTAKKGPMLDCAKAWTEETMPLRVRKVPKMLRKNVVITKAMFQTLSMPRFSWIITECRKAVPPSQGSSDAFSTGSQPQYPPQPRTSYAQLPPKIMPTPRNIHGTSVQRRVVRIQLSPSCLVMSEAMAKEKGTTIPTYPRYNMGGWITMAGYCSAGFSPLPSPAVKGRKLPDEARASSAKGLATKKTRVEKNTPVPIRIITT